MRYPSESAQRFPHALVGNKGPPSVLFRLRVNVKLISRQLQLRKGVQKHMKSADGRNTSVNGIWRKGSSSFSQLLFRTKYKQTTMALQSQASNTGSTNSSQAKVRYSADPLLLHHTTIIRDTLHPH